jgi:O-Antigen ligase
LTPAIPARPLAGSGGRLLVPGLIAILLLAALSAGLGHLPGTSVRVGGSTIVAAAGAVFALVLILTRLEYGVLLLPPVAVLVPFSLGTGTESAIPAVLLLVALLLIFWIGRAIGRGDATIVAPSVALPLVAFAAVAALATVYSDVERDPLVWVPATWTQIQVAGVSLFVLSAATWFVTANTLRELRWVKWLVWSYIGIGALTMLIYLARRGEDLDVSRVGGLFSLWVIALAFGQALFNDRLSKAARVGVLLIAMAWLARRVIAEPDWISGWLPAVVALVVISLGHSRRTFGLALLVVVIVGALNYDAFYQSEVTGDDAQGNFLRLELWEQNLQITKDHLVLGTGAVGYAPYYLAYFPSNSLATHSNLLDIFAETGLIGSGLFVWFVVAALRATVRTRRRWPTGFGAGFVNGALGGLVGMVVAMAFGDWVIPFVYNQTIAGFRYTVHSWLFLGALAAMQRIDAD